MQFKIISFDMFQTLVNVNSCITSIWQQILGQNFRNETSLALANQVLERYHHHYHKLLPNMTCENFSSTQDIFSLAFCDVFKKNNIEYDSKKASEILISEHKNATFYDDIHILNAVYDKFILFISSDADMVTIQDVLKNVPYHKTFVSGEIRAYKLDKNDLFFKEIVKEAAKNNIMPNEILHIGDSFADVIGSQNQGIKSCWLNRDNQKWNYDIAPDYQITSLTELEKLLNLNTVLI